MSPVPAADPSADTGGRVHNFTVSSSADAARIFNRLRRVEDLTSPNGLGPSLIARQPLSNIKPISAIPSTPLREVAAPIMPVRPDPHLMDKFDEGTNGGGVQPNPGKSTVDQPGSSPKPSTVGQKPDAGGQPAQADPATPKKFDPRIAVVFPGLINPDGTVRTPEQGYAVDTPPPPPLPLGVQDIINWPARGETKTLPSGITVTPESPTTYPGAIDVNGATYPGDITATTTVVVIPGRTEPMRVVDTRITVNQPHPILGGTSWTAKLDDNQQATQIDITNPTTGIAGIAMSDTGLRVKSTTGTTMTVNAQGQPDGPFENPNTGERGVAEPLPGGGYRAKFNNGAITEYNANGDVVNHLPAPRADTSSDDGFWSKANDARLAAGGWITDGLSAALGAVQQKVTQGVAGLTSAASGGSLTPQGRAYLPAANGESLEDPNKAWKDWFDKLSINGTATSLGHVITGWFAWTDLGRPVNSVGEALGYHPNLPNSDTVGEAMGDNVKAAQKEFDKGNTAAGFNYLGMATGLLPDFRDPNSVLVWGILAGRSKNSAKGSPGAPEVPLPAPMKPLPKPPATLGSGIASPATATPSLPIRVVLDRQPRLEKFDLAQSLTQQGLDVQQLQLRMAEIRTAEKVNTVVFEADVTAMVAAEGLPARAGSRVGSEVVNRVPHDGGALSQNPSPRNAASGNVGSRGGSTDSQAPASGYGPGRQPGPHGGSGSRSPGSPTNDHPRTIVDELLSGDRPLSTVPPKLRQQVSEEIAARYPIPADALNHVLFGEIKEAEAQGWHALDRNLLDRSIIPDSEKLNADGTINAFVAMRDSNGSWFPKITMEHTFFPADWTVKDIIEVGVVLAEAPAKRGKVKVKFKGVKVVGMLNKSTLSTFFPGG
ncbi:EndoU domain-containing protein [Nocardia tengchongensis]|uniref:EndoU domain-containing protein n=1 Tax=Nocardia tengchongensis TaxID=2055889 RepID=UPI0036870066